jgi:hypothetical protein
MGMDVYGKKPSSTDGKYFRNNVWWWRPLADYCCEVAPDITDKCSHWQSNDGDGLDAIQSIALADALQAELDSGMTEAYEAAYEHKRKLIPREPCKYCAGTGVRADAVGQMQRMHVKFITDESHPRRGQTGWCNGCDGLGSCESMDAAYPFSADNVRDFVKFLRASGGFEIC